MKQIVWWVMILDETTLLILILIYHFEIDKKLQMWKYYLTVGYGVRQSMFIECIARHIWQRFCTFNILCEEEYICISLVWHPWQYPVVH